MLESFTYLDWSSLLIHLSGIISYISLETQLLQDVCNRMVTLFFVCSDTYTHHLTHHNSGLIVLRMKSKSQEDKYIMLHNIIITY